MQLADVAGSVRTIASMSAAVTPIPVNLITYGTLEAIGDAIVSNNPSCLLGDPAVIYDQMLGAETELVLPGVNATKEGTNLANWFYWTVPAPMTVSNYMNNFPIFGIDPNFEAHSAECFAQMFLSHEAPGCRQHQVRLRCAVLSLLNNLKLLPPCPQ